MGWLRGIAGVILLAPLALQRADCRGCLEGPNQQAIAS